MSKIKNRGIHMLILMILHYAFANYSAITIVGINRIRNFMNMASLSKMNEMGINEILRFDKISIIISGIFFVAVVITDIFILRDAYIIIRELNRDYKN